MSLLNSWVHQQHNRSAAYPLRKSDKSSNDFKCWIQYFVGWCWSRTSDFANSFLSGRCERIVWCIKNHRLGVIRLFNWHSQQTTKDREHEKWQAQVCVQEFALARGDVRVYVCVPLFAHVCVSMNVCAYIYTVSISVQCVSLPVERR